MKIINKGDGSFDIDMSGSLLVSTVEVSSEGDCSGITIRNGYNLGFLGGRLRTCWEAVKWIWRAHNGEVTRG
jgi:hypothetical protein